MPLKFSRALPTKNPRMSTHLNNVANAAEEVNTVEEVTASGAEEEIKEREEFRESVVVVVDTTKAPVKMKWASLLRPAKNPREEEVEAVTVVTVVVNVAANAEVEIEVVREVTEVVTVDLVKVPAAATVPNRKVLLSLPSRPSQLTSSEESEVKEEVGV